MCAYVGLTGIGIAIAEDTVATSRPGYLTFMRGEMLAIVREVGWKERGRERERERERKKERKKERKRERE